MTISEVKTMISEEILLGEDIIVFEVTKGWSKDKKYYIEDEKGAKFFLRIRSIENLDNTTKEYRIMRDVYNLGINMSKPIGFGRCSHGKSVYILLSWIEGTALEEQITMISEDKQYNLGIEAGKILRKFHSISAPEGQEDWEQRMLKKFDSHLEKYIACGIKIRNDDKAVNYVKDNLHLLKNRPQTFHHGDFHVGNLILTPNNDLGVIDFNRWDYGDPYEDFYKMMLFSKDRSIPFAKGQIAGYFTNQVPKDFFEILALYLADVILYSVVWAVPFGEEEVKTMLRLADMVFSDYDYFDSVVPKWFQ